ncbi:MAG: Sulfite oxidase [Chloroflexi bacterium]|nr:Sulfite oxidase [Chloroflexota bacterium]
MLSSEIDPALTVYQEEPLNAGTPLDRLCQRFTTPPSLFYARNHAPIPVIDQDAYRLSVVGDVNTPLQLSLDELRRNFPQETITATLQCAGNRRAELMAVKPMPGQLPWQADAIGTAAWTGVPLHAVLQAAGVSDSARHVAFTGRDVARLEGQVEAVTSSIPLDKAMRPEVLLAYEMDGAPLPHRNGAPLRAIVPGYVGIRSIKWLGEIRLQAAPSESVIQTHDYKLFPPQVEKEEADWDTGLVLDELSVNSAICNPADGAAVAAGAQRMSGYAMAGGGRDIARVDVSADGGATWTTADLLDEGSAWTWRLWQAELNLPSGSHQLVARAYDEAANTQPEQAAPLWNFAGYMNNAWHRITVNVL